MEKINDLDILDKIKLEKQPLLIMFGGEHCGVCKVLKPQISDMLEKSFPEMKGVYIDCHNNQIICSQNSIFTLPVVQIYFDGIKIIEEIKVFGLNQLIEKIKRPYDIWTETNNN